MTMDEKIARINALAHKAKAEGLTDEEKEEQAQLRRDYIDSVKALSLIHISEPTRP